MGASTTAHADVRTSACFYLVKNSNTAEMLAKALYLSDTKHFLISFTTSACTPESRFIDFNMA